jgi:long-chain fatty acid transport protein
MHHPSSRHHADAEDPMTRTLPRRTLPALAALLALAWSAPARATNGMRMTGFGAAPNALGGVGAAAALDASTIVSNPAGLDGLDRRLDLSLTWFKPTVEYQATGIAPPFVNQPGATLRSNRGGSPIPNVGVVVPLGAGFTAGLGAFGVGGLGVDYDPNLYSGRTLTSFQQLRLAPALAWRLGDLVSIGVAVNGAWAQLEYDVASGFGQVPHQKASALGLGATAGVTFRPVPSVSIGLAYESKTAFRSFEFKIPLHAVPDGAGGQVTVPGGTDVLDFDQPAVASAGVAWRAAPALLLAADVQRIQWSGTNGRNQPRYTNDTSRTGALPFDLSWEDQLVYKVGAEWEASPGWRLRAGWNYGKAPIDTSRAFESLAFPAVAEHHVSAGLGYAVTEAVAVNVGATYAPKVKASGANAAPPASGGQGIAAFTPSMSQRALDAGLAWRF